MSATMLSERRHETMLSTVLPSARELEPTNGAASTSPGAHQTKVSRFSVSLPSDLLSRLDDMVLHRRLPNRSHAIAEMARRQLTEHARELGTTSMAGTISLVYDYRKRNLQRKLADIQHQNYLMVVTSMHVHLEHSHYLEVLLVQGQPRVLRVLADTLAACKGVEHASLQLTATAMPPLL
jgi:CopG family nickel-responsive transcriptional regulator